MLPSQRHLFDLPDDVAYLNCAYMSPLMRAVVAAGERGVRRKAQPWRIGAQDFFGESETARGLFATLVNAAPDDVAIVPSASYGIETAARNVPLSRGQEVVVLADQFPSNLYPWRKRAEAAGASLVTVAADAGELGDALVAAIGPRTAVVAVAECRWTDGALVDLAAVSARCRDVGAALVLDLTQSAGVRPVDVARIQPDFLVAACYKWLLGPYSLGFLYAHPRWHGGEALEQNWITRAGSDDFSRLVRYSDAYQPGARRFDMGERASFHLMPMAVTALEQLLAWRVEAVAETLSARTRAIQDALARFELEFLDEAHRGAHFLAAGFPRGLPDGLLDALAERGVWLSVRGDSMRITPHVYNTDGDVARLIAALDAALP